MRSTFSSLVGVLAVGAATAAGTTTRVCPLLGPAFPVPSALGSSTPFQTAAKSLDDALSSMMETGISAYGAAPFNATAMSIGMFSSSEEELIYEYHFTSSDVQNGTVGTGFEYFNDPISKYIPELSDLRSTSQSGGLVTPNWNEVTIGHLASHMAGIPREYGIGELGYSWESIPGLQPLPDSEVATCNYMLPDGSFKACTAQEFLDGVVAEPALFRTSSSPVYSNDAFALLGIALENITGCTMEDLFTERIVEALGLDHTSYTVPNSTTGGVIPVNTTISMWDSDVGAIGPAGGYFSSTSNMAAIGRAMLNSTLLSPASTRQWIKPVTLTPNVNVAVGAPWEIFRAQIGGQTVDMYTKNGAAGSYATLFALIPDLDVGFSILMASELDETSAATIVYLVSDVIAATMLPGLQEAASQQANETFAGYYVSEDGSSSLYIEVDDQPGLRVVNWTNNGTNFLNELSGVSGSDDSYVDFRIQPNQLYSGNQVGFTGVWETHPKTVFSGPFDLNCITWGSVDPVTYGKVGLEQFVFETDPETGKATTVVPNALRVTLKKE